MTASCRVTPLAICRTTNMADAAHLRRLTTGVTSGADFCQQNSVTLRKIQASRSSHTAGGRPAGAEADGFGERAMWCDAFALLDTPHEYRQSDRTSRYLPLCAGFPTLTRLSRGCAPRGGATPEPRDDFRSQGVSLAHPDLPGRDPVAHGPLAALHGGDGRELSRPGAPGAPRVLAARIDGPGCDG